MVEVFKTDIAHEDQGSLLRSCLLHRFPGCTVHFDLDDCDRVMRLEAESIETDTVLAVFRTFGLHAEVMQ